MSDRIKCKECGAESHADGATLVCGCCYDKLKAEVYELKIKNIADLNDYDDRVDKHEERWLAEKAELKAEVDELKGMLKISILKNSLIKEMIEVLLGWDRSDSHDFLQGYAEALQTCKDVMEDAKLFICILPKDDLKDEVMDNLAIAIKSAELFIGKEKDE